MNFRKFLVFGSVFTILALCLIFGTNQVGAISLENSLEGTGSETITNISNLSIGTDTISGALYVVGDITATGDIVAENIGGTTTITAGNVSAGQFGANTGGGNYSFPGTIEGKYAGQVNSASPGSTGWYRIASNSGNRANAEFTLRDFISGGGHSTLTFRVGESYDWEPGMSFTLLSHSYYSTPTFTKVRVWESDYTYDPMYVEVYVNRVGSVNYSIYDNLQSAAWTPVDWTAGGTPSGTGTYSAREFELNKLFNVGDYDDRFTIDRGGKVGIGITSPGQSLDVSGNIRSSGEVIGTMSSGYGQLRMVYGNYGAFWRNDGSNTYLLLTNSGDQYGAWNSLRPFYVNNSSGNVTMNHNLGVGGTVTASSFSGSLSGTVSAANISSGSFGANTGGGNYTFPASLTVDTNTLYVDASNNRVGIGTTSPGTNLDINNSSGNTYSTLTITNPSGRHDTSADDVVITGGIDEDYSVTYATRIGDLHAYSNPARLYGLSTNVTFNEGGNILVFNPNYFYGLKGQVTAGVALNVYSGDELIGTSGTVSGTINNGSAGHLVAAVYGNDASTGTATTWAGYFSGNVYSSGNVGIGTTSPASKLDVRGDEVRVWSGSGTVNHATGAGDLYVEDDLEVDSRAYASELEISGNAYMNSNLFIYPVTSGGLSVGYSTVPPSTGAIIKGNVGIGTDSPGTQLHMYKGSLGTGATDFLKIEGYRSDFGVDPAGVAILFKDQDTNNATNEARIKMMTVNDTDYGDNDEAASNLIFETTNGGSASDKMIITGRGDIGIGTLNPGAKLDVAGTIYSSGYGRESHSDGHLVGSYNNVGSNDSKSNPIYTIGSSYNPTDTALSNMYGIGYSHDNFWYDTLGVGQTDGWGMYVAADGDIRATISGTNGNIWSAGSVTAAGGVSAAGSVSASSNMLSPYYRVVSGNGNGIRFWDSDSYKIHMGNAAENHYGPVTDYSIKMNMSNTAGRGWTWGVVGATPVGALNTSGDFQVAGSITADSFVGDGSGLTGVGGGSWTTSGSDIYNANSGNVGIGTSPSYKLHVSASLGSSGGRAGYFYASGSPSWPTVTYGLVAAAYQTSGSQAVGFYATADSSSSGSGRNWGIKGYAVDGGTRVGVEGRVDTGASYAAGIVGTVGSYDSASIPGTFAGYFNGNVKITGSISKGSGTFDIPYPEESMADEGYRLRHSFVESPTRGDNIYRYSVSVSDGRAVLELPEYFQFLNENPQVWVSPDGHFGRAYGDVTEDLTTLEIYADEDGEYNVLLIGTRKDEVAKEGFDEKGVIYQDDVYKKENK